MKPSILLAVIAGVLFAQPPPGQAPVSPDTVVAKLPDGKEITAAELDQLRATVPGVNQALRANGPSFIQVMAFQQYMTDEARKLKLDEQTPWKQQINVAVQNVLLSAYVTYIRNHYEVTPDQTDAYYKEHQLKYQQAKIKTFMINFKTGAVTDPKDVEAAAKAAFAAAHAKTDRSEADAKARAEEAVKQLRAGADFAKIVDKYADDENKQSAAEDTMTIKSTGPYPPEIQKAVAGLKVGDIPDPVRQVGSFYVIKIAEVTSQPLNDVREDIVQTLRAEYTQTFIAELQKRFRPQIVRPDYFTQAGPGK